MYTVLPGQDGHLKLAQTFASFTVSTAVGCSFFLLLGSVPSQYLRPYHAIVFAQKQSSSVDANKLGAEWGKDPTPGVHLELVEWKGPLIRYGGGKQRKNDVAYQLVCTGLPQGKTCTVWLLQSGTKVPIPFLPGFSANEKGELTVGPPLTFVDLVKAEPVDAALISSDQSVRAFAGTVPFPIRAQDGGCSLSLRILTKDVNSFQVMLEGFQPGEDLRTISRFESDVLEDHLVVPAEGKISVQVSPKATGKRSGKASYEALGKSCHPVLEYEWGKRSYFRF